MKKVTRPEFWNKNSIRGLRGLSVKKSGFLIFFGKATIIFFDFLHYDRGQHYATSGLGVWFQK